ncbi:A/G-specific adenine glycosylase [Moraxella oblonga]|uniref:A/G-specific adenine glycosylase n=1 Tax=Moraxella oblonga TaxID=200413 RepID=UPI000835960F|nr:A/G-specific adenine glycosylase [Moraxella oblonga]
MNTTTFAPRLLDWFVMHGRHDLPWQYHHQTVADIYAVWLSEIMLQQTQVATVIGYFKRFIDRFPTVQDLANAEWDEVATLWAGLGYYARAKNLHKGAKQVAHYLNVHGHFPQTVDEWQKVHGVGRSTAGAIVAMGVRERGVICDGNVKRVLTRWAGIDGDITKSATDRQLWELADTLTPTLDSGKFAQAMMDLGATVCTRTRPTCATCPLSADCTAYIHGNPTAYPVKNKKSEKPHRLSLVFAFCFNDKLLWLKRKNTHTTIWEGLYCLPILTVGNDKITPPKDLSTAQNLHDKLPPTHQSSLAECQIFELLPNQHLHIKKTIKHTLTHFHWHLSLVQYEVNEQSYHTINHALQAMNVDFVWQTGMDGLGVPKAMVKLLDQS